MTNTKTILGGFGLTVDNAADYIAVQSVISYLSSIDMSTIKMHTQELNIADISGEIGAEALLKILTYLQVLGSMKELPLLSVKGSMSALKGF